MNNLFDVIKTFRHTAKIEYGPGILNVIKCIYYSLFRINIFNIYVFDLNDDIPHSKLLDGYYVLKPSLTELDRLRTGKNLTREFYCDKTHGLTTCRLLMKGSEIAYIHWICGANDPSRFFRLGEGVVRITNSATVPAFRGQHLMSTMFMHSLIELKKQGYHRVVSAIHSKNIASIKSILRAGYHQIGAIRTVGRFHKKKIIE